MSKVGRVFHDVGCSAEVARARKSVQPLILCVEFMILWGAFLSASWAVGIPRRDVVWQHTLTRAWVKTKITPAASPACYIFSENPHEKKSLLWHCNVCRLGEIFCNIHPEMWSFHRCVLSFLCFQNSIMPVFFCLGGVQGKIISSVPVVGLNSYRLSHLLLKQVQSQLRNAQT